MRGWLIGGETFPVWSLLGAAFVLVGVWMIFRKSKAKEHTLREGEPGVQVPEG
jgi:drug/metabolite transporter (DMT)-like permease